MKKLISSPKLWYFLLIGGLLTLCIQTVFHPIKEKDLNGYFEDHKATPFSVTDWKEGAFQQNYEAYLKDHAGFHHTLVRLFNQKEYWWNRVANANGVLIGKENYLFEENYISSYLGINHIGEDSIRKQVMKLRFLQDTLQQQGKTLLVVIAPGKGWVYPEKFPKKYSHIPKKKSNYESYLSQFNTRGIHYIDLNRWFVNSRDKSPHPLYPKTGIHWSKYGELMAFDSILNTLETMQNGKFGRIRAKEWRVTRKPDFEDNDIEKGMNLLFPIYNPLQLAYPVWEMDTSGKTFQGTIVFIADSFYWGIYNYGVADNVLKRNEFWYYNEEIYTPGEGVKKVSDLPLAETIAQKDIIVLLVTEGNFHKFGFGFVEKLYAAYKH